MSEHIRVHTVIDRFLEHARIFHFKNGGQDEVFCSSADWTASPMVSAAWYAAMITENVGVADSNATRPT